MPHAHAVVCMRTIRLALRFESVYCTKKNGAANGPFPRNSTGGQSRSLPRAATRRHAQCGVLAPQAPLPFVSRSCGAVCAVWRALLLPPP